MVPQAASTSVLVTGGASGIGAAVVDLFRARGHEVFVLDVDDKDGCDYVVDVRDANSVERAVADVAARTERLDVLVNCAGISGHEPLATMSDETWHRVMDVNVTGTFHCLRAAGRHMISQGSGAIVNIASIAAQRGGPGRACYVASKAAIVGLTRAAAVEWARSGVRVNAVSPGYVQTPLFAAAVAGGRIDLETILARTPTGRLVQVEEVAEVVAQLASTDPALRSVTGQVLTVDGGYLLDDGGTSKPSVD